VVVHQLFNILKQVRESRLEIILEVPNVFIRPFIAMCHLEHVPELQDPAQVVPFHLSLGVIDPFVTAS